MSHNIPRFNFLLMNGIVSWASKKKPNRQSFQYKQLPLLFLKKCLRRLLHKLGFCLGHCNQRIIGLMKNITHHRRTKDIDIWHHYFEKTMKVDEVVFEYCLILDMGVNILMNSIPQLRHIKWTKILSLKKLWVNGSVICKWSSYFNKSL
jgi:hypothetical protein